MELSEDYLDKMLNFAIKYHKYEPNEINKIPSNFDNLDSALEHFQNALEYETHTSLQEKSKGSSLNKQDDPTLYSVNLDSKEPGLVLGKNNENNVLVHIKSKSNYETKHKKKKEKSKEEIEKLAEIELKKIQQKEDDKIYHSEMKEKKKNFKEKKKEISNKNKELNKIENQEKKLLKEIAKMEKEGKKYEDELYKNKYDMIEKIKGEAEEIKNFTENQSKAIIEQQQIIENYDKDINNKKEERKKKIEENRKKKEEKKIDSNISDEETKKNKKKNNNIKPLENKAIIECDDDELLDEFYKINNIDKNTDTEKKEYDCNQIELHPSPIPLERHLYALSKSDPNPIFLPILLYGKKIKSDKEPLVIYHGPPGTGKTFTLINELKNIIPKLSGNILICAPSNIGVLNLYNRARNMGIYGRLIVNSDAAKEITDLPVELNINKKIYFSTISMRSGRKLDGIVFNTIMIDEAAQCPESSIWGLLRKSVTKLYLAGDHKQLPALVSDKGEKMQYGRSIMHRLIEIGVDMKLLDTQRRMHPKIVEFSNIHFYNNKLKTEYSGDFDINPFEIINVDGIENKIGNSFSNKEEVLKVIELSKDFKSIFDNIVVISPYQAQCDLLKKMDGNLNVHTLDSFQGREADMIILCTVRTSTLGFWNDERRLNVGLTRAKHVLRVLGKVNVWDNGPLLKFKNYFLKK